MECYFHQCFLADKEYGKPWMVIKPRVRYYCPECQRQPRTWQEILDDTRRKRPDLFAHRP